MSFLVPKLENKCQKEEKLLLVMSFSKKIPNKMEFFISLENDNFNQISRKNDQNLISVVVF